jgi:hypothetical protein
MRSDNLPNSGTQAESIARPFGAFSQLPIISDAFHPYAFQKVSLAIPTNP